MGAIYDGQHVAIVDEAIWDQVQALLAERRNNQGSARSPKRSLLVGLVYDGEGRKMTPSHTSKGGKRYRYYVTHGSNLITAGSLAWRISAPELERIVIDRLKRWFEDRRAILDVADVDVAAGAIEAGQRVARRIDSAAHRQALVSQLVKRIDVTQDAIRATLDSEAVRHLLGLNNVRTEGPIALSAPATRIRQGKDVRMIVADQHARSADTINKPLVALLAEAQKVHQALIDSPEHSVASLADTLGKCRKRSTQLLRIALLAPDLVAQCIARTQPISLTTKKLLNTDLPISWQEQRTLLAFT